MQNKINDFLKQLERERKSDLTKKAYQETLTQFIETYLPQINENKITIENISGFITFKEQQAQQRQNTGISGIGIGREMKGNKLSNASINRHYSAIRQYLLFIKENQLARELKSLKRNIDFDTIEYQDMKKIFEEETLKRFYIEKMGSTDKTQFYIDRMKLLLDFIFSTGLRAAEVHSVKKSCLKLDRDIPVVEIIGKGNKTRIVELGKGWLKEYKNFLKNYEKTSKSEYLFTDINGNQLSYSTLKTYVKELGFFVNVPNLSMHKLRHAYAIKSYETNKDIVKLSKRLGHSNLNTTMIYLNKVLTNETALISPMDVEGDKK